VIREFDGPGTAGVNRTNWDLRWTSPAEPTPEQVEAAAAGFDFGPRGPLAEPGEYTVKIKAGSREQSQKVVVEDDPRIALSAADRAARHDAISQLYAMTKSTDKLRRNLEGLQSNLKTTREQWKQDAGKPDAVKIPDDVLKAVEDLQKKVEALAPKFFREREGLGNAGPPLEWKPDPLPQQTQELLRDLDGFAAAPGGQQRDRISELTPLVADAISQARQILDVDLAALNKKMNDAGIPHIVAAKPASPGRRGMEDTDDPSR